MTYTYPEDFPPVTGSQVTSGTALAAEPSTDKLRKLAWALYTSGTFLETVKGGLGEAGLSSGAITAIDAAIDSYVDLVNAAIPFLTTYVNAVSTGEWPPVDIPMPPVIDPNATTAKQVINDIDGGISTAIIEFQKSPKGEEVANGLKALQAGLENVVATVQKYYPNLL